MLLAATFVTINDKLDRRRKLLSLLRVQTSEIEAEIVELEQLRKQTLNDLEQSAVHEAHMGDGSFVPADSLDKETADRPKVSEIRPHADDLYDEGVHGWRAA